MNAINNGLLDNLDENINFDATNPFYQFLEKQAAEFQLFGDRLKCELQNSYREFIKQQQKQQQQQQQQQVSSQKIHDVPKVQQVMIEIGKPREPLEKISNESIESPSPSLSPSADSLKARIEELETDSIIRNQDIEKQKAEIQYLKQELNKFNNFPNLDELENMKKEIKELNDFKNNFTLLFNSFEQTKLEVLELKLKLQQRDIENDRLLAEQLQNEDNNANIIPVDSNDSGIIDGSLGNSDVNNNGSVGYASNVNTMTSTDVNNNGPVGYPSNVNTMTSTMTSSISPRPPGRPLTPHSRPSSSLSRRSHRFNYNNNPFDTTSTQNLQNNNVRASYGDLFDTPTTNDLRTNSLDTFDSLRTPRRHVPIKRMGTYSHIPKTN